MNGFLLDANGDVTIENGQIQMLNGAELIRQSSEKVLGTNKGEWFLNTDEGIDFSNLLGKEKNEDIIKNEIAEGLSQVDSSFVIESFSMELNREARKLKISFSARNEQGETIKGVQEYA